MTRAEITAFFPPGYSPLIKFGGLNFAVPPRAWVLGEFATYFRGKLSDLGETYRNGWVCRDYALACKVAAQECWCRAITAAPGADTDAIPGSPACGLFFFHPDAQPYGVDHAINAWITDAGLEFFDPQNFSLWTPTYTELLSAFVSLPDRLVYF